MSQNFCSHRLFIIAHDLLLIPIAWMGAYWLRFNLEQIPTWALLQALSLGPLALLAGALSYQITGSYRMIWGFATLHDLVKILKSVSIAAALLLFFAYLGDKLSGLPRSIVPLYVILLTSLLSGSRLTIRLIKDYRSRSHQTETKRVLIIGAGSAGEGLVREMLRHTTPTYQPIGFIDDKPNKLGNEIHGVRILGGTHAIPELVRQHHISQLVLAIPSASSAELRTIMHYCEQAKVPVHTLPGIDHVLKGQVSLDLLREVSLEDLLGRNPVSIDWHAVEQTLRDKCVLVSGAGGSIGSEVCQQIARSKPARLLAVDNCEFNLFTLQQNFAQHYPNINLQVCLLDVQDRIGLDALFTSAKPEVVFHAAAYKHVPMLQNQIRAAVTNNIIGTQVIAELAQQHEVKRFVMVSTDKAVNPQNIMGACKRVAEMICQSLNDCGSTQFITVRFGNVLGSAGSVVPIFKKQIEQGGPITVTHPEVKRYFMTIPEASQLILQAMTLGQGGEIFVLDMGDPIRIKSLAEHMVHLSGKQLGRDIDIEYTQLRPGEKLFEELFHEKEHLQATPHQKILLAQARNVVWQELQPWLAKARQACEHNDSTRLVALLSGCVPEMQ